MRRIGLALLLLTMRGGLGFSAEAETEAVGEEAIRIKIDLADGSSMLGIPEAEFLPVQTRYGWTLDISYEWISSMVCQPETTNAVLLLKDNDRLTIQMREPSLAMNTIIGRIAVKSADITSITVLPQQGNLPHALRQGLLAFYPFKDRRGTRVNGIVNEAEMTEGVSGRKNAAYRFNGETSSIDLGADPSLKMTNAITLAAWIKVASFEPVYQNIISDHAPNEVEVGCGKILRLSGAELQFHVGGVYGYGTGVYVATRLPSTSASQWIHVAGTYDRKQLRLYVNGELVEQRNVSVPLSVNSNPWRIGKSGFGEFFRGDMDQIRIYDRALTETEIAFLYGGCL